MTLYVAFDLETTGLDISRCEAIEIAGVVLEPDTLLPSRDPAKSFGQRLHPGDSANIEPGVLGTKNHYNAEIWAKEAVSQFDGWRMFCDWLHGISNMGIQRVTLVGHNVIKFDHPIMERWTKHFALKPNIGYIPEDTMYQYIMACQLLGESEPKKFGLSYVAKDWGINFDEKAAHGAVYDAKVAGCCYAIGRAYLNALVDCGRQTHANLIGEAWRRLGLRPDLQPLPVR